MAGRTKLPDQHSEVRPEPTGALVTRWGQTRTPTTSAEPAGEALLFAGEATNPEFFGTVHDAYLSGIREAERILG